jgi:hypothetical protein
MIASATVFLLSIAGLALVVLALYHTRRAVSWHSRYGVWLGFRIRAVVLDLVLAAALILLAWHLLGWV